MINALYIGGPTVIIEVAGLRFMTDPTLDPSGGVYRVGSVSLEKSQNPSTDKIGIIDFVLLSHDQHADNLDTAGRKLLADVTNTFTTKSGAQRLGGNSIGLDPWEDYDLSAPDGTRIKLTATPARHGPSGIEKITGDVIGFILSIEGKNRHNLYITGDTVFYDGIQAIAQKYKPDFVFLFAGAARTRGPINLTMGTNDAIDTAFAFRDSTIIPVHYEGWKHFTENEHDLEQAFGAVGIGDRLKVLKPGVLETLV